MYSVRGPQGGYRLARQPEQYTVGEILRVTEGSLAPVSCLGMEPNPCPRAGYCTTLSFWEGLYQQIDNYVDSVTLGELVSKERGRIVEELAE